MSTTQVRVAIGALAVTAVAVGSWFVLGTPGLGGDRPLDVLEAGPEPSATETPTPTPTATPAPTLTPSPTALPSRSAAPSPSASPTASPTPRATRRVTASPSPSPTSSGGLAAASDVGTGKYRSVLPRFGYGFCPCDELSFKEQVPPPAPSLSLSCEAGADLPSGQLVPITVTVRNTSAAAVRFRELAGPRFVYLSLATDPNRTRDQNGGFADNAGHTSKTVAGWWSGGEQGAAYRQGAGTVSHLVPARGSLEITVIGATARASDATPLQAGRYALHAGFMLADTNGAWTCPEVTATVR